MIPQSPLLPRWSCILLAVLAAVIGLASSAVTAQFFVYGLQRIEPDTFAREALIAAGVLMIVTELAAFGLAALLPKAQLQALRWRLMACGLLLLSFESATIYVTQVALVKTGETSASAASTRIADLRASIDSRRAAAAALQVNGIRQSDSIHGFNRAAGALALRESLDAETAIAPLAVELAALEASKRPTLTDVLGTQGMLAYTVARALLISVMGLVMFGAAGALLRPVLYSTVEPGTVASTAKQAVSTLPRWTSTPVRHSTAYAIAAVPMGAIAVPITPYMPPMPQPPVISVASTVRRAPPVLTSELVRIPEPVVVAVLETVLAPVLIPEPVASTVEYGADGRYEYIKGAVLHGLVKPSVRALRAEVGCGSALAQRYLQQMADEGVIAKAGQGWSICAAVSS